MDGISNILQRHKIPFRLQGFPSIFHVAFGISSPIETFRDTFAIDRARYVKFTAALIERGVRALERGAWFVSTEHDDAVIDRTLDAVDSAAKVDPKLRPAALALMAVNGAPVEEGKICHDLAAQPMGPVDGYLDDPEQSARECATPGTTQEIWQSAMRSAHIQFCRMLTRVDPTCRT